MLLLLLFFAPHWLLGQASGDILRFATSLWHLVLVPDLSLAEWRCSLAHIQGFQYLRMVIFLFWSVPFSRINIRCSFNHSLCGRKPPVRQEPHVSVHCCVISLMATSTFYFTYNKHLLIICTVIMHRMMIALLLYLMNLLVDWTQLAASCLALSCGCSRTGNGDSFCPKWLHHSHVWL